jgi:hypothetical protein
LRHQGILLAADLPWWDGFTLYTNGRGRIDTPTMGATLAECGEAISMSQQERPRPAQDLIDYVSERAPELDPQDVSTFMDEHPKPDDEPGSHLEWAVRVLKESAERDVGDGLSIDRVVSEMRRHDR